MGAHDSATVSANGCTNGSSSDNVESNAILPTERFLKSCPFVMRLQVEIDYSRSERLTLPPALPPCASRFDNKSASPASLEAGAGSRIQGVLCPSVYTFSTGPCPWKWGGMGQLGRTVDFNSPATVGGGFPPIPGQVACRLT